MVQCRDLESNSRLCKTWMYVSLFFCYFLYGNACFDVLRREYVYVVYDLGFCLVFGGLAFLLKRRLEHWKFLLLWENFSVKEDS